MSSNFASLYDDVDLLFHFHVLISLSSVSRFPSFKEHNFREHLPVVASKYSICDMENKT